MNYIKKLFSKEGDKPRLGGLEIFKFIGPGLLVTMGFIDPGNWAANLASGADFGYTLLWVITLSTILLMILQHNVAHLGIITGLCLSEAATAYLKPKYSKLILSTAMIASISTSLAEILGGAIALNMLFKIPIAIGSIMVLTFVMIMIFTNSYRVVEKWIIGFVTIIGLSFIYELALIDVDWEKTIISSFTPTFPEGSMLIIMSIMGAVVMPHNLFLHSEVIQSRQWNLEDDKIKKQQLKYEFFDTFFSMLIGWAINSAMIILAAATFHKNGTQITELQQAKELLVPMLGNNAGAIFALALLFAGVSSTITSGMAAGSIFAGIFGESYDIKDKHSKTGVAISLIVATLIIFLISNPFSALVISQMLLSLQLPFTIFLQIYLTSSKKVMGEYRNKKPMKYFLYGISFFIAILNVILIIQFLI